MTAISMLIQLVVTALTDLLPTLTAGTVPDSIIALLVQILPLAEKEVEALVGPIEDIITALKSSSGVTAAQISALEAQLSAADAAFDAQAKADGLTPPGPTGAAGA